MLIIFAGTPVAAPGEAVLCKQHKGRIFCVDLIGERLTAVGVELAPGGSDVDRTVPPSGDVRIIKRIEVDGKSVGVEGSAL